MKTQYASIADKYHEHMLHNLASAKDDFVSVCGLTEKDINVLEYGCGSGIDAKYFIEKYKNIVNYVGVDNSDEMLEKFNETFKQGNITGILADMDKYDPKTGFFDLVFGMYSIHYTNDLEGLMKKVYTVLKPGGYFCFRDAHPIVGFLRKVSKRYDTKEMVDFPLAGGGSGITVKHPTFTFEEYVNAASNAGFRIVSVSENMGRQSRELGIDGFEVPTTFSMILKKEQEK